LGEGELKKRILKRLMILHKGTKLPVFVNIASSTEADIDEAKKDFELIIDRNQPPCDYGCEDEGEFWQEMYRKLWIDLINGKERWFGDSS